MPKKIIEDDFDESEMFSEKTMISPIGNPLAGYFRMPGLSIKIPTRGKFLPAGACTLDPLGQIEVFPMRSADELLLKAPDALMSGLAIERLLESCVPGIKTPRMISAPDLDVLLLAIRAATYGSVMPMEAECPECEHVNSFDCDLSSILATMTEVPDNLDLRLSDEVVIAFKPHTVAAQTKMMYAAYNEQRAAQQIDEEISDEKKQDILRETFARITGYQTDSICDAVTKVSVPNAEVVERRYIREFIANANRDWSDKILKHVEYINTMGIDRNVGAVCARCNHEWFTTLEFNASSFFEPSSSA